MTKDEISKLINAKFLTDLFRLFPVCTLVDPKFSKKKKNFVLLICRLPKNKKGEKVKKFRSLVFFFRSTF